MNPTTGEKEDGEAESPIKAGEGYCPLKGAADMLAESAKQHRQRGDTGHAAGCDSAARELRKAAANNFDEVVGALEQMVEFFSPNAWGSNDNKADALRDARDALSKMDGGASNG